ncbi:MAG TPA: hypothetical protein VFY36_02915 [Solirubrobacteraceae bacterium]|nr:hypothetical protein [Solirubrobacteraceae bacterium]
MIIPAEAQATDSKATSKASESNNAAGSPESLKYLLGGAGVLQAALTAVGVSNGGVAAMVINHRTLVTIGFSAVLLAMLTGALVLAAQLKSAVINSILGVVGTLLLFFGIGVTGYAALAAPAIAKAPSIDTTLSISSGQLVLVAKIKATGIPESSQYWVEIDARKFVKSTGEGAAGRYAQLGTPLYQAQLGADSQGNVEDTVTLPLVPGNYKAVSVEAWSGPHAGPCGSLQVQGGANLARASINESASDHEATLEETGRAGCAVLRLPR